MRCSHLCCLFLSIAVCLCPWDYCLSVCLSFHLSVCLPLHLPASLSFHLSVSLSFHLSVSLSFHLSVYGVGLFSCLSVYTSVRLSSCLSVGLPIRSPRLSWSLCLLAFLLVSPSACLSYLSALTVCLLVYPCLSICLSASLLSVCLPVSSRARSLASASLGEWMLRSLEAVRLLGQLLGVRWECVVWAPSQLGTVAQHCQRHTRPLIRTPSPRSDS